MTQIQTKFKQTEIGLIPEDWEVVELGEISEIKSGKSRPKESGIFPVYGGNGILDYANDFNIENESIIIGRVGAYCGCIYKENNKFWLSDNALGLVNNEKSNLLFLYYLLKKMDLNKQSIGGAQPLLTQGILKQLKLPLPPLPEQKAISEILSSLDDKIELLEKQNKTLEHIGQALFKSWFVDFEGFENDLVESEMGMIPRGWKVGKLENYIDIRGGLAYKSEFLDKGENILLTMGAVSGCSRFNYSGIKYYSGEFKNNQILNPGDLIIATRDVTQDRKHIGAVAMIPSNLKCKKIIGGTNVYIVDNLGLISNNFLYYLMKSNLYRERIIGASKGTTVIMIIKDDILKFEFPIPKDLDLIKKFDNKTNDLKEKIENNNLQIKTLSNLRDSLLPRLMSGKIRVV